MFLKYFDNNPHKKPLVTYILYNNRIKMIKFLEDFLEPERKMDQQFLKVGRIISISIWED